MSPVSHSSDNARVHSNNNSNNSINANGSLLNSVSVQQQHDHDLRALLNESIRAATRTCIWVFRCQITKRIARAFHVWCRYTKGMSSVDRKGPSLCAAGKDVGVGGNGEGWGEGPHVKALPMGADLNHLGRPDSGNNSSRSSRPDSGSNTSHPLSLSLEMDLQSKSASIHTGPVTARSDGTVDRSHVVSHNASTPKSVAITSSVLSDLSSPSTESAVQALLNSSIRTATDSLHDDKRSLLCESPVNMSSLRQCVCVLCLCGSHCSHSPPFFLC